MVRVLQVFDKMDRGGAETFIMNVYRNIDVKFDFVVYDSLKGDYDDEIKKLGGKIYHLERFNGLNYFKFKKQWKEFFKNHQEYKVIHGHAQGTAGIYLRIAKKYGLYTISHSHNTTFGIGLKGFIKEIFQKNIYKYADKRLACGVEAGQKLYKNHSYEVIYNSIDLESLEKKENKKALKKQYGYENKFVIGQVGRFVQEKNQLFTLDLFNELCKKRDDAVLVYVGRGPMEDIVKTKVKEYNLEDKVIFMGVRSDIPSLLKSFDIFAFPSLFEGFPLSLIEAQATKIKCLSSNNVTKDTKVSSNIKYLPLDLNKWLKELKVNDDKVILDDKLELFRAKKTANYLSKMYKEAYDEVNNSNA